VGKIGHECIYLNVLEEAVYKRSWGKALKRTKYRAKDDFEEGKQGRKWTEPHFPTDTFSSLLDPFCQIA
jgi:hypothetical protein